MSADPDVARYIVYVHKQEDAKAFLAAASADVRRQTWVQLLNSITPAPWMKSVVFPAVVDRVAMKAYFRGEEMRLAEASRAGKRQGFASALDELED